MKKTKKIGLTGVMGAGKSSVIRLLKQVGITVLDCDEINRTLLQKGRAGYQALCHTFSEKILDQEGNLDTAKMSDLIFRDQAKKQQAEAVLHPLIQQEIKNCLEACDDAVVVIEVPLLFEVHWETFFDEVWVVACDHDLLLKRLSLYRNISHQETIRRMKHQLSQEEKCAKADVILYNNGSIDELKQQLVKEIKRISEG